ncbi:MAG: hypothetical protein ACI9AU_000229 [Bacteroidia bacterium]|jgi:hypothetical protein
MNRIITSFRKANKDLLKFILEEYPDGVEDDSLVNFPKAAGGSIRALEIVMNNHIYLVKMDEEEYYQKYLAKEEDEEEEDMDDDLDVDEVEVDEEVEEEDDDEKD